MTSYDDYSWVPIIILTSYDEYSWVQYYIIIMYYYDFYYIR